MKINLIAFPFAGGSSFAYKSWVPYLGEDTELHTFEPVGHGRRMRERQYSDFRELVQEAFEFVKKYGSEREYVLFGHSMGAYVAYEVYRKIKAEKFHSPYGIIYSGNVPPHIRNKNFPRKNISQMSDEEFIRYIEHGGGIPSQIADMPEIRNVFLNIIKNDYILMQNYRFEGEIEKFEKNIAVFYGKKDIIPEHILFLWKKYTDKEINLTEFDNGHMFVTLDAKNTAEKCMDYISSLNK